MPLFFQRISLVSIAMTPLLPHSLLPGRHDRGDSVSLKNFSSLQLPCQRERYSGSTCVNCPWLGGDKFSMIPHCEAESLSFDTQEPLHTHWAEWKGSNKWERCWMGSSFFDSTPNKVRKSSGTRHFRTKIMPLLHHLDKEFSTSVPDAAETEFLPRH